MLHGVIFVFLSINVGPYNPVTVLFTVRSYAGVIPLTKCGFV